MEHKVWSVELNEQPVGRLLVFGTLLMVSTQRTERSLQRIKLCAYELADGNLNRSRSFEQVQVSGLVGTLNEATPLLVTLDSTDWISGQGMLMAFDIHGEVQWRYSTGAQRLSAPGVDGDVICVTAGTRTLSVVSVETGVEQSKFGLDVSASFAAPVVANGVAYVPCRGPHLLALGLDGRTRWRFDAKDAQIWLHTTPTLIKDRVITTTSAGAVLALRIEGGSLVWSTDVGPPGKSLGPPAADDERIYVGAADGLYALNPEDGREVWTFSTTRRIEAPPVLVSGVVYIACHDHHVYALDALNGKELWQCKVGKRRIELPPVVTSPDHPCGACVLAANRGGLVLAISRPLSAEEHEAAGNWAEAASASAELGRTAYAAELLESHNEPLESARLWETAGEKERAALQYETAQDWQRAARLWEQMNQPLKQAEALKRYAIELTRGEETATLDKVSAWRTAADAFAIASEKKEAFKCQREIARLLQQPLITVDVEHEGLALNAWTRINFIVRNEGHGTACHLVIRAVGDQFEGEVAATREIASLRSASKRTEWLDIRPLQHGRSVPLRLSLEYRDKLGEHQVCSQTLHLPVARTEAERGEIQNWHIYTGGGTAIFGGVDTGGGDFVGRDITGSVINSAERGGERVIKILFLAANPTDTGRLRLDEESRAIDQALRQSKFRDVFDIRSHWAVRVSDIQGLLLRHQPDIVHFCGHGSQSSEIVLEDNFGKSHGVSADALSDLFSVLKDNIRCVVLNACFSEQQARSIAEHIDCVVGMSQVIGDKAAISFATAFYQALGYGRDVESAFKLGRVQINLENLGEQDTPQLISLKSNPAQVVFVHDVGE